MNTGEDWDKRGDIETFRSSEVPCSYLPGRTARSQVILSAERQSPSKFGYWLRQGFRRSGVYMYRPICAGCSQCRSVRVLCHGFRPNRAHRRVWQRYRTLTAECRPLTYSDESFALYARYQKARHPGGGMDQDNPESFAQFLLGSTVESRQIEFRDGDGHLRMVALIDVIDDGVSAVYTYFEPDWAGLGTYGILWQVQWVKQIGGEYLYLGYWIAECPNMNYKRHFQPMELFNGQEWTLMPPAD